MNTANQVEVEVVPRLNTKKYPRGNVHKGKPISQQKAANLKLHQGRVPGLLYDKRFPGFDPINQPDVWPYVIRNNEKERKLFLQTTMNDDDKDGSIGVTSPAGHLLHLHRDTKAKGLKSIFDTCEFIMENHGDVRKGNKWGGMGSMCPAGEHLHLGKLEKCAIKDDKSKEKRRLMQGYLANAGIMFKEQFANRGVGFNEMLEKQREVWVKGRKCPKGPACFNGSRNLANPEHTDKNDYSRSYAVWVMKSAPEDDSAWLLFPQWGVAIQLCHGTFISWDGASCAHCSSVPQLSGGNAIYSLFTALPKDLVETLSLRHTCKDQIVDRMTILHHGQDDSKPTSTTLLKSLKEGTAVRIRLVPPIKKPLQKCINSVPPTLSKAEKRKQAKIHKRKDCKRSKREARYLNGSIKSIDNKNETVTVVDKGSKNKGEFDLNKQDVWNRLAVFPLDVKSKTISHKII